MRWLMLVFALFLPGVASAQIQLISVEQIDTRFGQVAVVGSIGSNRLTLNGVPIDGVENWGSPLLVALDWPMSRSTTCW